jgi:acylpyruvate hydrolase
MEYIAGFTVLNDVSIRDWQRRTSQWDQGKNFEGTTPIGPTLVTPESCDDAADLRISCSVDGVLVQDSRTSQLLFSPSALLSYVSTFTTLEPGDVISTGTPGGVGGSMTPPVFLRAGQLVETTIEGIGTCRNLCVSSR